MPAAFLDVLHILLLFRIQIAENLIFQHLGKADDGVQRGTQLMAHVSQEFRFSPAGLFDPIHEFLLPGDIPKDFYRPNHFSLCTDERCGGDTNGYDPAIGSSPEDCLGGERPSGLHYSSQGAGGSTTQAIALFVGMAEKLLAGMPQHLLRSMASDIFRPPVPGSNPHLMIYRVDPISYAGQNQTQMVPVLRHLAAQLLCPLLDLRPCLSPLQSNGGLVGYGGEEMNLF
ncbi:MAG: hypothetical protein DDT21_02728 [Syntrophomonadaceae bacterium]|nr:hypothetical protein [Bacillota bacterium]